MIDQRMMREPTPLPLRYFLLVTGAWSPELPLKFLPPLLVRTLGVLLILASWGSTFYVYFVICDYLHRSVHTLGVINSLSTLNIFGSPYLFLVFFLRKTHYSILVQNTCFNSLDGVKRTALICSLIFFVLWLAVWLFYVMHWESFTVKTWQKVLYPISTGFLIAPWACANCLFSFCVCVFKKDVENVKEIVVETYQREDYGESEREKRLKIIRTCNDMLAGWRDVIKWLNVYISLGVTAHVLDLILYSCTFWQGNFGSEYPNWQYLGILIVDNIGVLILVFFAGQLTGFLHGLTQTVGSYCVPKRKVETLFYERMELYQYLNTLEETVGMKVVGIRITINVAFVAMVTIITATTSFTAFIIPRINQGQTA